MITFFITEIEYRIGFYIRESNLFQWILPLLGIVSLQETVPLKFSSRKGDLAYVKSNPRKNWATGNKNWTTGSIEIWAGVVYCPWIFSFCILSLTQLSFPLYKCSFWLMANQLYLEGVTCKTVPSGWSICRDRKEMVVIFSKIAI